MKFKPNPVEAGTDGDRARTAFGPEALSRFTRILDEVALDLIGDGASPEWVRSKEMRTRLAQRLLAFAGAWWTDTQIQQLLLRMSRNGIAASRTYATVPSVQARADGDQSAERAAFKSGSDDVGS
jgi:hypothetical protein